MIPSRATCTKCGEEKPSEEFSPNRKKKNGLYSWCRECNREAVRVRNQERRRSDPEYRESQRKHLASLKQRRRAARAYIDKKKGTTCSECEGNFLPEKLHFHHKDPATKTYNVSHMDTSDFSKIDAEVEKCVVLCGTCHPKQHAEMRQEAIAA